MWSFFARYRARTLHQKMMIHVLNNDCAAVRKCLERGALPNRYNPPLGYFAPLNDHPPLFAAAHECIPEMLELLLEHHADPYMRITLGDWGRSADWVLDHSQDCLEFFVDICQARQRNDLQRFRIDPAQALRTYQVLRRCITPTDKVRATLATDSDPLISALHAWEQQQVLLAQVAEPNVRSTPRRI